MFHFISAVNFVSMLYVITCIVTNNVMAVHWLAVLVIPETSANQIPALPPPSNSHLSFSLTTFDLSSLQLCSSDSPLLCRRGEEADLIEPPASCCCLEELDRSMATSSSISSSSISSSSSSSSSAATCSTCRASLPPPRRSEVSQNESGRVESDGGLEHFLDISRDFLCIPVRTETETETDSVQSAGSRCIINNKIKNILNI